MLIQELISDYFEDDAPTFMDANESEILELFETGSVTITAGIKEYTITVKVEESAVPDEKR